METIDPATGRALPEDAIQRIVFLANKVHVYNIPPLASTKGYTAATWTADGNKRQIFTARVRIIETAYETGDDGASDSQQRLKVDVVLEDASTGQLFAAAPYTTPAVVEPVLDSSRFFALRVQDGSGRKAVLGIGFEERSEAFDFGVALQEAQKALGTGAGAPGQNAAGQGQAPAGAGAAPGEGQAEEKRDYSLKEGETITVNLSGTRFGRRARPQESPTAGPAPTNLNAFALAPPPSAAASRTSGGSGSSGGSGGGLSLAPPPSASDVRSRQRAEKEAAKNLGFDDGQFDEFA